MIEKKGKVGRPMQMVKEAKVDEHIMLSPSEDTALREQSKKTGKTLSELITDLIDAAYLFRKPQELHLATLLKEKSEHDQKSAILSAKIITLQNEIRQQQEINDAILRTNLYLTTAFRMLYDASKSAKEITMYPEAIEKVFGITFNIKKCNENFAELESMRDDELISVLELKKIKGHAKREEEILSKIGGV